MPKMKKKAKTVKCKVRGCKTPTNGCRFCHNHGDKTSIQRFLRKVYYKMSRRVQGKDTNTPHIYLGKQILPKDVFMTWARNHPEFLRLYKRWVNCGFDRKLTPSVNRVSSSKGYTLDNMEWVTSSQNSVLAASVRKLKGKQEVYKLLGVTNVK